MLRNSARARVRRDEGFLRGLQRSFGQGSLVEEEKAESVLAIVSKYTCQPSTTLKEIIPYVDPDARLNVKDVVRQIRWYQAQGFIGPNMDPQVVGSPRYVNDPGPDN